MVAVLQDAQERVQFHLHVKFVEKISVCRIDWNEITNVLVPHRIPRGELAPALQ
jgi:hypothetical protein